MNIYSSIISLLTNSANNVTGITLKPPNINYYNVTDTQFQELLYYLVWNIFYVLSWILIYYEIYLQHN
jgi:hypothetical protein